MSSRRGESAYGGDIDGGATEEPSWAIPVVVFLVTGLLSLLMLAYYLSPSLSEIMGTAPDPSDDKKPIELKIADKTFVIPANFTRFAAARRGGTQERVSMYALLPKFQPYTPSTASAFEDNTAQSSVIHFDLSVVTSQFGERERFEKIYKRLVNDPEGVRGPHGFRKYVFSESSGYKDEDLFVWTSQKDEIIVLRCFKATEIIASPTCRRDMSFSDQIDLKYRFKRSHLSRWKDIDRGMVSLVEQFEKVSD